MKHQTITQQCNKWIGYMRNCDNRQPCQREQIRLTHDQAMRLCFEISFSGNESVERRNHAHAACAAGRPWDLLAGAHLFGWLVPMHKSGFGDDQGKQG